MKKKKSIYQIIILLLISPCLAKAQIIDYNNPDNNYYNEIYQTNSNDSNLTLIGQWMWGSCEDVAVAEKYAFVGNGKLLQIFDISNTKDPKLLSELQSKYLINQIEIHDNYVYLTNPFMIINVSDKENPVIVYEEIFDYFPISLTLNGRYCYIGDFYSYIFIYDISDPEKPKKVGWTRGSGEITTGIVIKEPYMFVLTADGLLVDIFDITDKSKPKWISDYVFGSYGGSIAVDSSYLYLGCNAHPRFQIIDVSDPYNPQYIGGLDFTDAPDFITIKDTLALISLKQLGFKVVSIADRKNPKIISQIDWFGIKSPYVGPTIHTQQNGYVFLASIIGLWIVDISNISALKTEYYYRTAFNNYKCIEQNDYIYIANALAGLKILDVSNPKMPYLTGYFDTNSSLIDIGVDGQYAYLLTENGFNILDIDNPKKPVSLGEILFSDTTQTVLPRFMTFDGLYVYVVRPSKKLTIIDIKDKKNPSIEVTVPLKNEPYGLAKKGTWLFVAEGDSGIQIFDVKEPFNIPLISKNIISEASRGIYIKNNLLFSGNGGEDGIKVYDISDECKPVLLSQADINGGVTYMNLITSENYLYVSSYYNLEIFDISNPNDIKLTGYSRGNESNGISAKDELIFLCNTFYGFSIFRNDLLTFIEQEKKNTLNETVLYQNYPNPFNSQTTIRYYLPKASRITVNIYNILGEKVLTFIDHVQSKGEHNLHLDLKRLSSGQYFIVLKSEYKKFVKRITLVK